MIVGVCDDLFQDVDTLVASIGLHLCRENGFEAEDVLLTVLPEDPMVRVAQEVTTEIRSQTIDFVFVRPDQMAADDFQRIKPGQFDAFLFDVSIRGDEDVEGVDLYVALTGAEPLWRDLPLMFVSARGGRAAARMRAVAHGRRVVDKVDIPAIAKFLMSALQLKCFDGPAFGRTLNRYFLRGAMHSLYHAVEPDARYRVKGSGDERTVDLRAVGGRADGVAELVRDALGELAALRELTTVDDMRRKISELEEKITESHNRWVTSRFYNGFAGLKDELNDATARGWLGWAGCSRGAFVRIESEDNSVSALTGVLVPTIQRALRRGAFALTDGYEELRDSLKAFTFHPSLANVVSDLGKHAEPQLIYVEHDKGSFRASRDGEREVALSLTWSHHSEFSNEKLVTAVRNQGWSAATDLCRVHLLTATPKGEIRHFRVTTEGVVAQRSDWVPIGDDVIWRMPLGPANGQMFSSIVFVFPTFDQPRRNA